MLTLNEIKNLLAIFSYDEVTDELKRTGDHAFTQILFFENRYAYRQIELFIKRHEDKDKLSPDDINDLLAVFAKRWTMIQKSNCSYLCDMHHPANLLFDAIAKALQEQQETSTQTIMMPTLKRKLKGNDIVLTDDHQDYINVLLCLIAFAKTGRFLTTNSHEERRELTTSEIERVIDHSYHSIDFYKAIIEKRNVGVAQLKFETAYRNLPQDSITFLYPPVDQNAIFSAMLADPDAHALLPATNLRSLFLELSAENKRELVLVLMRLSEAGHPGLLNKLFAATGGRLAPKLVKDFVSLLNSLPNQQAFLAEISPKLLQLYKTDSRVMGAILDPAPQEQVEEKKSESEVALPDAMDLSPPIPKSTKQTSSYMFSSVTLSDSDEPKKRAGEELPSETMVGTVSTIARDPMSLPPKKRIRREPLPSPAAASTVTSFIFEPSPFTFFTPTMPDFKVLCALAKASIEKQEPLEALHYIKHAYDSLCIDEQTGLGFAANNQTKQLVNLTKKAIDIFNDKERWQKCFNHYQTSNNRTSTPEWIDDARSIANRLLDTQWTKFLEGYLNTLKRHAPQPTQNPKNQ